MTKLLQSLPTLCSRTLNNLHASWTQAVLLLLLLCVAWLLLALHIVIRCSCSLRCFALHHCRIAAAAVIAIWHITTTAATAAADVTVQMATCCCL
jgi:hypothetical protein